MSDKKKRRETLYDTFAANLALYCEDSNGQFACPLCMRIFDRAAIDQLDLAHIVPDALGGSKVTLTCKQCNNRIGREIECHEVEAAYRDEAFKGKDAKPIHGRIRFHHNGQVSGSVGIAMNGMGSGNIFEINTTAIRKMSNPVEIERICEMFEQAANNGGDWRIEFEWPNRVDPHRAKLTYLHIAYLYLFHQFGYEWACSSYAARIREQLQHPDEEIINVRLMAATPHQTHTQSWGINIIYAPEEAIGFLVTFPPLQHLGAWATVWMPLFWDNHDLPQTIEGPFTLAHFADTHTMLKDPTAQFMGHREILDVLSRKTPAYFDRLTSERT